MFTVVGRGPPVSGHLPLVTVTIDQRSWTAVLAAFNDEHAIFFHLRAPSPGATSSAGVLALTVIRLSMLEERTPVVFNMINTLRPNWRGRGKKRRSFSSLKRIVSSDFTPCTVHKIGSAYVYTGPCKPLVGRVVDTDMKMALVTSVSWHSNSGGYRFQFRSQPLGETPDVKLSLESSQTLELHEVRGVTPCRLNRINNIIFSPGSWRAAGDIIIGNLSMKELLICMDAATRVDRAVNTDVAVQANPVPLLLHLMRRHAVAASAVSGSAPPSAPTRWKQCDAEECYRPSSTPTLCHSMAYSSSQSTPVSVVDRQPLKTLGEFIACAQQRSTPYSSTTLCMCHLKTKDGVRVTSRNGGRKRCKPMKKKTKVKSTAKKNSTALSEEAYASVLY
jgi:hypothetical protein